MTTLAQCHSLWMLLPTILLLIASVEWEKGLLTNSLVSHALADRFPWPIARECVALVSASDWMPFSRLLTAWLWLLFGGHVVLSHLHHRRDFCFPLVNHLVHRDRHQVSPAKNHGIVLNPVHWHRILLTYRIRIVMRCFAIRANALYWKIRWAQLANRVRTIWA